MYVVAFNGPPQSGKDTVARMLVEHLDGRTILPVKEESLSLPLRHIAYAMVGSHYSESTDTYEEFKNHSFEQFGRTGRQLMIDVSESFLKPTYGIEIMAKMLIERNAAFDGVLLIRDSGFQIEVEPLLRAYGEKNCYFVRCHRPGYDFAKDSREWVYHPNSGCSMDLNNDGSLEDLRTEAVRVYGRLVNQMGWKL